MESRCQDRGDPRARVQQLQAERRCRSQARPAQPPTHEPGSPASAAPYAEDAWRDRSMDWRQRSSCSHGLANDDSVTALVDLKTMRRRAETPSGSKEDAMSSSAQIRKTMLWLAGGSAVAFAATRLASWAVAALRTSLLASLSAMFASGAGVGLAAGRDVNASIRSLGNPNIIEAAGSIESER